MLQRLRNNLLLILVLFGIFLLRIPSFFEPYWYGDEGIYLVLAQMINRGAMLYRDIWDNKPPLLYLLYAIHPTLLWAKISATLFVLGTCFVIYILAKKIFTDHKLAILATLVCGVFLSIPLFEGTIANAELYFTLPIAIGALLFYERPRGFWLGLMAVVAFLFKVPAVLDFAGLGLVYFVTKRDFKIFFPMAVAFVVPLALTAGYFYLNHGLADFLTAAFSQNANYVAIDSGPLSKLSNPLFIRAIVLLITSVVAVGLYLRKRISWELLFLTLWFGFSLYGALLSNRPYMHYLLQIVPVTTLLIFYLLMNLRKYWLFVGGFLLVGIYLSRLFLGAFHLDNLGYYQNFWNYISERETWEDYVNHFDTRTLNSYQIADFLQKNTSKNDPIFVWGDASFVYVLSQRPAVTKFIQAHHLTTINASNYSLILKRIDRFQPKYILVKRPEAFPFPALETLVAKNYRLVQIFGNMYVYQNMLTVSAPPWKPGPI